VHKRACACVPVCVLLSDSPHTCYRNSAIAEEPCDVLYQSKSCKLVQNYMKITVEKAAVRELVAGTPRRLCTTRASCSQTSAFCCQ